MYLIDTNVVSESRKKTRANSGVKTFFKTAVAEHHKLFLSVITVGELRRGVELIRYRGDEKQARKLESWLDTLLENYADYLLDFTTFEAQVWGRLRVPRHENSIDKQIAATALTYDLTLVTRNVRDFADTGAKLLNPFD